MKEWMVGYLGSRERAQDTKTFTFQRPDDLNYQAGQFLYMTIPPWKEGGEWLEHHFSFSSSPSERDVEFTTRLTGHDYKNRLDSLEPGARVRLGGPSGTFVMRPDMPKAAYLCAGVGITPARSTVRWALDVHAPVDIVVLYGNRDLRTSPFVEEFEAIDSTPVRVVTVLSEPPPAWQGRTGRIDASAIFEEIPDWQDRLFFVSGPPLAVADLKQMLLDDVRIRGDRLITEDFPGYK